MYVLSATQTLSPYREPMGIYTGGEMLELFPPAAADRLFGQAGVSRKDIDVAELYDATSYMTLRSLESYGFAADGAGWRYVLDHGTGPDSPLPVNTHGGHLSEAYLHGMNGILEAVRQLRGTACNQVAGAEVALVGAGRQRHDPGEVNTVMTVVPGMTELTAPYWEAAREGRLAIQECRSCGQLSHPPLPGLPALPRPRPRLAGGIRHRDRLHLHGRPPPDALRVRGHNPVRDRARRAGRGPVADHRHHRLPP